jgi:hypothetical protein
MDPTEKESTRLGERGWKAFLGENAEPGKRFSAISGAGGLLKGEEEFRRMAGLESGEKHRGKGTGSPIMLMGTALSCEKALQESEQRTRSFKGTFHLSNGDQSVPVPAPLWKGIGVRFILSLAWLIGRGRKGKRRRADRSGLCLALRLGLTSSSAFEFPLNG